MIYRPRDITRVYYIARAWSVISIVRCRCLYCSLVRRIRGAYHMLAGGCNLTSPAIACMLTLSHNAYDCHGTTARQRRKNRQEPALSKYTYIESTYMCGLIT
jgi:hypothetical protein